MVAFSVGWDKSTRAATQQRSSFVDSRNTLQLTPDSLLPSQQFVIGGGQSVRGYRQNIRSGDNGFRVAIEDRITVQRNESGISTIQLAPFLDMGAVWNKSNNPNQLPDQTFLVGAGLGLLWNQAMGIDNLFLRLDYGFPFIDLSDSVITLRMMVFTLVSAINPKRMFEKAGQGRGRRQKVFSLIGFKPLLKRATKLEFLECYIAEKPSVPPHPNPPLAKATVYTQVIESLPVLELPHPNPPLAKGRELNVPVSPLGKGGNFIQIRPKHL